MLEIKRILVPTDFSDPSTKALAYGKALARQFGASLHVLHVIDARPFVGTPPAEGYVSELSEFATQLESMARESMALLAERGIGFKSLTEQIDTTTPGGKLIFHVFGALAEFERDVIRERTQAGLAAARARGRLGGRPRKLADAKQLELARTLYAGGQTDIATICATLGISRATLYRSLKAHPVAPADSS